MLHGEKKEGTFVEHLEELRWAIIRSVISVTLLFPLAFYFSDPMIERLIRHFCPAGLTLRYFSPIEPFMVKLKLSFFLALFIAAPYVLRQAWGFVAPGLYLKEKRFAGGLLICSWFLFLAGGVFALLAILPMIMQFSLGFQTPYLEAAIGFEQFISLVVMLMLGFATMFQFPAGIFILIKSGIVSLQRIKSLRSFILVGIMVVSAILTPPDAISQLMMGVPTYLLFELGLLLASMTGLSGELPDTGEEKKALEEKSEKFEDPKS